MSIQTYEESVIYLKDFYTYAMGVYWRLYLFYVLRGLIPFFIFSKSTRLHAKLLFAVRSRVLNPSRVIYRKEIKSLADFLPDAKKKNQFFDILISDYPAHELVLNLKKNQNFNFTSLSKIHDWSLGHLYRYSFKVREIFGFILGSGAILLSTVPEPIVLKFVAYESYQVTIFCLVVAVMVYFAALLIPTWIRQTQKKQKSYFIKDVIDFGVLMETDSNINFDD